MDPRDPDEEILRLLKEILANQQAQIARYRRLNLAYFAFAAALVVAYVSWTIYRMHH
jgi:hypothetical protein